LAFQDPPLCSSTASSTCILFLGVLFSVSLFVLALHIFPPVPVYANNSNYLWSAVLDTDGYSFLTWSCPLQREVNRIEKQPISCCIVPMLKPQYIYRVPRSGVLDTCHPQKRKTKRKHDCSCTCNFHLIKVYHTWVGDAKSRTSPSKQLCTAKGSGKNPHNHPCQLTQAEQLTIFRLVFRLAGANRFNGKGLDFKIISYHYLLIIAYFCRRAVVKQNHCMVLFSFSDA
jgi:hypothetical protein